MAKEPAKVCTIDAPCKINLHLSIGEKRPDGFHCLESLFASLALADTLRFECSGNDDECFLSMDWEGREESIPPEKNLVLKAVSLFRERTGCKNGLNIRLKKRIPAGAGLGGGSSDAASVLLALNLLSGASLSKEELMEMAAFLGSDVPFFLSGGVAFVSGRGEKIEPVLIEGNSLAGLYVVLVKPPFYSDTAFAYGVLDHARKGKDTEKRGKLAKETLIRSLEETPSAWPFYNDFLPVLTDSRFPNNKEYDSQAVVYRTILDALREYGASFTGLSGSGSCCFGIFNAMETAEKAVKALSCRESPPQSNFSGQGNFINLTFFLAHSAKPVLQY
jgi:4-diphosphocytidyl-2-C-methyl-D-erythritol kinase